MHEPNGSPEYLLQQIKNQFRELAEIASQMPEVYVFPRYIGDKTPYVFMFRHDQEKWLN